MKEPIVITKEQVWEGFPKKEAVMKDQPELTGMPERTPLGQKAIEYLNDKTDVERAQLALDETKAVLVQLFLAEGKTSIKVEGQLVSYAHVETDKITAKQAVK